jgi:copper(I)-binding protein
MNRSIRNVLLGCLALAFWGPLQAGPAADLIEVRDPYARAVPPGLPNSAAFLALINNSAVAHALVGAESPVAKVVELHSHTMEGGMMRMRPVERIALPPGETVRLEPGGYHVMLIGLLHQLMPGQQVGITLVYEDGSRKEITAPVRRVGEMMHHH